MTVDPEKLAAALYLVAWAACAWKLYDWVEHDFADAVFSVLFGALFAAILMVAACGAILIVAFVLGVV